jgi:autotransporter-associated beta strand protein
MSLSPPAAWRKWFRGLRPRRKARAPRRPTFRPGTDFVLEERLAPATRVWTGAALGGNANWSAGANWVGGTAPSPGDDLVFPGGAKQIATSVNDFGTGTPFNSVTIDGSGYALSGNGISLGAGGLTVNSAAGAGTDAINLGITLGAGASVTNTYAGVTLQMGPIDTGSGFALTFAGSGQINAVSGISDAGSVVKNGPGTLFVRFASYSGPTTLNAGVVQVEGGTTLGFGAITVNGGATLQLQGGASLSQPLTLNGSGVGGGVVGSTGGALEASGGINYVTGPVTLGGDATIGVDSGSAISVAGSTVDLAGHTLTVNSAGTADLGSPIIGSGNLVVNAALTTGPVGVFAAGTYTGTTTVAAGTLDLNGGTLTSTSYTIGQGATLEMDDLGGGSAPIIPPGAAVNLNGGTLMLLGSSAADATQTVGTITLTGGHSNILVMPGSASFLTQLTAAQLVRNPGATVNFSTPNPYTLGSAKDQLVFGIAPVMPGGNILPFATVNDTDFATYGAKGAAAFSGYKTTLTGAGPTDVVKLTSSATASANQTIAGLLLANNATLTINSGITLGLASGELMLGGSTIKPSAAQVATLNLGAGEGYVFTEATSSISAQLTGGGVDFSGLAGSALTLSPGTFRNSYGGTYLDSTNLSLTGPNALGTAPLTLTGGTLNTGTTAVTLNNSVSLTNAVVGLNADNLTLGGPVTLTGANVLTVTQPTASALGTTITGAVSGSGSLTKLGAGTLTLSASNSYGGGTILAGGTLALGAQVTPVGSGPLTLAGNANSASTLTTGVPGGISLANPLVLNNAAPAGGANVTLAGTNPFTFTGPITLNGQTTLQVNQTTTIRGPAGGAGGLTKSGAASLTLSGSSNYTGATMLTAGPLVVNGSQTSSAVGVLGGTLSGSGAVGFLAAGPAGQVTPGTPGGANGTLTAAGANFSEGGTLTLQISGYTAGTGYNSLNLGGGPLVVGGDAANAPSVLTLDLNGLGAAGEAAGAVVYGSVVGTAAQFSQLKIVHNPNDFAATVAYGAAGLNVFLTAPGVALAPPYGPNVRVWSGADLGRTNWSDALNWVGNAIPTAGMDVIFPAGASQLTTTNDLPSGTVFNSLQFLAGGYTLNGNAITLSAGTASDPGGLLATEPGGSGATTTTVNIPITLATGSPVSFESRYAGTTLLLTRTISIDGATLQSNGAGTTTITGNVAGAQGITKNGSGTLNLWPGLASSYTGPTQLNAGITDINGTSSLGAASAPVTVSGGATLVVAGAAGGITVPQPMTLSGYGVGGPVPGSLQGALEVMDNSVLTGGMTLVPGVATWIDFATQAAQYPQVTTNPVSLQGAQLTINAVTQVIISAQLRDGGPTASKNSELTVNGALTTGNVVLTAANTFGTGTFGYTRVAAGTLTLSGANGSLATTDIELNADALTGSSKANDYPPGDIDYPPAPQNSPVVGTPGLVGDLVLDNTGQNNNNRLPDTSTLNFNGGEFTFLGQKNAATTETVGSLHVARGQSYLRMVPGGDTNTKASLILNATSLDRPSPGATIDFYGPKLGRLNYDQILFSAPPDPTATDNILWYATVDDPTLDPTLAVRPSYATYDNAKVNPLGILRFLGYQTNFNAASSTDIVAVTGLVEVKANTTVGGLLLDGGTVEVDPGVTLTVAYGILSPFAGGGSVVPTNPAGAPAFLTFGASSGNDGVVMGYTPITLSTAIVGNDAVTYGGSSVLTLSPNSPSAYAGPTFINSGTLALGTNNAPFGNPGGPVVFRGGAFTASPLLPSPVAIPNPVLFDNAGVSFLPRAGFSLALNGPVALSGNNVLGLPQNVTLTVNGQVADSTLASKDPNGLTVIPTAVSPGGGTLVMANPLNIYTGGTVLGSSGPFAPTVVLNTGSELGLGTVTLSGGVIRTGANTVVGNAIHLVSSTTAFSFGGSGHINFSGPVTVDGTNQLGSAPASTSDNIPLTFSGALSGGGSVGANGSLSLIGPSPGLTGNSSAVGGPLQIQGTQMGSPVPVTGYTLNGAGSLGFVAAGPGGDVQPGQTTRVGFMSATGADFSNGGTLRMRVWGYAARGIDSDILNLGTGTLGLGGTSRLVIDLAGLTATSGPGTITQAIAYGSRLGTGAQPVFSEVDVVNNPFNYSVELDYTATGLNIVIAVGAVDTPVLTVPGAQTGLEDIPLPFSPGTGNAITVADLGAVNPLQVTLSVSNGTLTLGGTTGLSSLSGNGTASVSFKGSPAAVTAALNGLLYKPGNDYTGPDLLSLSVTNPGGTGLLGGAQTATATVAITVNPTADSPSFISGGDISVPDNVGPQSLTWATGVFAEPPATSLTGLKFTIVSDDNPGLFSTLPAIAVVGATGPGTGTLTFTPNPTADGVAHLTVTLSSGTPDADGDTDGFTQTFAITVFNPAAPQVNDVIIHWGKQTASLLTILAQNPNRKDIPFQNISAIDLVFNEDVRILGTGSGLSVVGQQALDGLLGGVYGLSAPIFLPNHTVEWRLNTVLGGVNGVDKLAMSLAANAVQGRGNGLSMSASYSQAFNVLVGDANGDGVVDLNDQLLIARNLFTKYAGINVLDLDGDGTVSMLDYNIARARYGHRLP